MEDETGGTGDASVNNDDDNGDASDADIGADDDPNDEGFFSDCTGGLVGR